MLLRSDGSQNPSDLNSKSHSNLLEILNGDFWRHGPASFTADVFPPPDMKVYARNSQGTFHFSGLGLTELDIHLTNCENSVCMMTNTGPMKAGKLVSHAKRLSSAVLADKTDDNDQLLLAVGQDSGPAGALSLIHI